MSRKNIGYLRVSSNEQAQEGYSIQEQKNKILLMAERNGEMIDEFIADEGFSGSNLKRKGIQSLLKMISKNEVEKVYIWTPSRLTRNVIHSSSLTKVFDKYNVRVVCYEGHWLSLEEKSKDPESGFNESIIRLVDELEVDRTRVRTYHGLIGSAKAGNYPIGGTRAPIGYVRVKNGKGYRLEIDPNYKESIELIFSSIIDEHLSLREIMHKLNSLKLTDEEWTETKLSKIVNNPIYCGWFKYDWYEQEKHSPAFVSKDDWEFCQRILHKRRKPKKYDWLFKGRVFCEECGECLSCVPTRKALGKKGEKKEIKVYLYYYCNHCKKRILEDVLFDYILLKCSEEIKGKNLLQKIEKLEDKFLRSENMIGKLWDDYVEGYVDDIQFNSYRKKMYKKHLDLRKELEEAKRSEMNSFSKKSRKSQESIISSIIKEIYVDLKLKKVTKIIFKDEKKVDFTNILG